MHRGVVRSVHCLSFFLCMPGGRDPKSMPSFWSGSYVAHDQKIKEAESFSEFKGCGQGRGGRVGTVNNCMELVTNSQLRET